MLPFPPQEPNPRLLRLPRHLQFGAVGDEFDPHVHNALFQMPHDTLEPGCVAEVLKTGFMYHDMVLRPAEVGTVKGE